MKLYKKLVDKVVAKSGTIKTILRLRDIKQYSTA